MKINKKELKFKGIKLFIKQDGKEVARASLYLIKNDLHEEPYGYFEDLYVHEALRGQGVGTELIKKIIEEAKRNNCYKLILTSRHGRDKVHALYEKLGFKDHGSEFRMDLLD